MKITEFVQKLPVYTAGTLATSVDNETDARGWQFQFYDDGKFYFMTANTKNVYKQLKANPHATFYAMVRGEEFRVSGKVTFVEDIKKKAEYFEKISPLVKDQYKGAENPIVEFFYLSDGKLSYGANGDLQDTINF